MTVARFKDLCLDASEALPLARFWAFALHGKVVRHDDGSARVDPGRQPNEVIWVDRVPEPRTAKTRVHLDLRLGADVEADLAGLVKAGARILREPAGPDLWWVLADPDGNEFCAFAPRPDPSPADRPGVFELVVDSRDPLAQATWWAGIVGGTLDHGDAGGDTASIVDAGGFPWRYWVFNAVPEPKTVKNRMHWDIEFTDDAAAGLAALLGAGASLVREPDSAVSWWVLTDPEGNEFCAFKPSLT